MPLEDAKQFLAQVIPWPQPGDPPAFINIHNTFFPDDGLRPGQTTLPWTGRAVRTLDAAVDAVNYALTKSSTRDIYVCMSTQRHAKEKKGKNNYTYYTPIRGQDNAVAIKSIFLDIDFKAGPHGYDNQDEAIRELARYLKETGLPKPSVIVMSGGGVHCHWTTSQALSLAEWHPLANALSESTKRHNLKCDQQVTVDGARVLRIPSTWNRKLEQPRPVTLASAGGMDYDVGYLAGILEPYRVVTARTHAPAATLFPAAFQAPSASILAKFQNSNDLAAGLEKEYDPIKLDDVAVECGFVRDALSTGGKDYSQSEWNLSSLLATFTEGGRTDAHRMGDKHSGYTKESTDEMFDRKDRERREKGLGWPSCASISSSGYAGCQGCKHFAAGKTPLHTALGHSAVATLSSVSVGTASALVPPLVTLQVTNADLPAGYIRDADGIVLKTTVSKDDPNQQELVAICQGSMVDPWLQSDPNTLHFTSNMGLEGKKKVWVNFEDIGGMSMRGHLQGLGFMLPHGQNGISTVASFMNSWIKTLRETTESVNTTPFGWNDRGAKVNGFVFGGHVWTATGHSPAAACDPTLLRQYEPVGDIAPWKLAAKMTTDQRRPALDAILASAFGAPLVPFTGEPGVVMAAYSIGSGKGKTTTMRIAQGVWGHPVLAMQGLNDTSNAVFGKMGKTKNLPLYWDELKSKIQYTKLVNMIFEVTSAREKGRMARNTTLREPGQWKTLMMVATNDSLLDHVKEYAQTTTAGLYRVFEWVVEPPDPAAPGRLVPSDAGLMVVELERNHGVVGLEYAKFLGMHQEKIKPQMAELMEQLYKETSAKEDERFWVVALGAMIMGARYANHLGFTEIDEEALKGFLLKSLDDLRTHMGNETVDLTQEINVSNVLAGFLKEAQGRHTLFTNKIHVGQGRPKFNEVLIETSRCKQEQMDGVWVHVGIGNRLMRIDSAALASYLSERGISMSTIVGQMRKEYQARSVQARMGAGTRFVGATEFMYEIQLDYAPSLDII